MSAIHIPRRSFTQPQGRLSVAQTSLADGLSGLWSFSGGDVRNLVNGEQAVFSGAVAMPGIHGMAARTSSAAHYIRLAASALSVLPATSVVSVGVWKRKTDATLRASRFISDDTNNHFILQIYSDGKLYHNYGPPSPQASVSGAWGDDRLLLVSNGSQITLDQNGRQISSSGVIGAYSNAGNTGLYLGDFNTPDAADFDDFYTVAIWRRALSTAERVEWYLNPWQLFGADPTRVYSLPAAGGIPSSLNVAASNITTTGARITATLSF